MRFFFLFEEGGNRRRRSGYFSARRRGIGGNQVKPSRETDERSGDANNQHVRIEGKNALKSSPTAQAALTHSCRKR